MHSVKRDQIRQSLRDLANSYAASMALLEQTMALISEELALDPVKHGIRATDQLLNERQPQIDSATLAVRYAGKTCFLGNTFPFKLLARLARRPNAYLTHDELLADVWNGVRSDAAVRSVVKVLRSKLRKAGLAELAAAIDGSVKGRFALRLNP